MFVFTKARFCCTNRRIFLLQGYNKDFDLEESRIRAYCGGKELPVQTGRREGLAVRQKYFARGLGYEDIDREYDLWITLPARAGSREILDVYQEKDGRRIRIYRCSVRRLAAYRNEPDTYLETFHEEDGRVRIGGWAVGAGKCTVTVTDRKGNILPSEVTWHFRPDLLESYPELSGAGPEDLTEKKENPPEEQDGHPGEEKKLPGEGRFGFEASFTGTGHRLVYLAITAGEQKKSYPIRLGKGAAALKVSWNSLPERGREYLRRNGLKRTVVRSLEKISEKTRGKQENYMSWRKQSLPSAQELRMQRDASFDPMPLISIVVPLYRTQEKYLRQLVDSVRSQTYANWELCLSDGSGDGGKLLPLLRELAGQDGRIRFTVSDKAMRIAENTNAALEMASGDYIAFADHDDLLTEDALYECACRISRDPLIDLIYSDEDKVSMDGKTFFEPHFKPDFNPDLLRSMNYICHLTVVSARLLEKTGLLREAFDGAQDYDFVLRCTEQTQRICHIPKVLYHWRSHAGSTSENPQSKRYAFEAGMRAVQAHYDRCGIAAEVSMGPYPGLYRTRYILPENPPLVSILIPSKDHSEDLKKCIESIQRSSYRSFEILVIENNSEQKETFVVYEELKHRYDNVRILTWEHPFNYSLINNYGASFANGSLLLLLNNDTQMTGPETLEELVGPALRSDVGAVGALLVYPDHTIQHAGVIIGYGGIAGHAFQFLPDSANGYFSRIICAADLSAVTAACMMVPRTVYEELGGLDGTYEVAFNDIDFCLRIRESGRLIVYNPYARLIHDESKSRGHEDTPAKIARFNREADRFIRRWPQILKDGDPAYNPNLSLDSQDFSLKRYR